LIDQNTLPRLRCTDEEVQRWNNEWVEYLRQEWMYQLVPHTEFPERPPLPADPMDLLNHSLRRARRGRGGDPEFIGAWSLMIYGDREALENQRVMELGCGCGNLGKLMARYVRSYLGVDYSTLALSVARLVSPENCTYIHVADGDSLTAFAGQIDTVISRYFWIHQNLDLGRQNLHFLEMFLRPGGRVYLDFFWPDPDVQQFITLPAPSPLSKEYPSAQFWYTSEDVQALIQQLPFRLIRETVSLPQQRRYVVLEKI